jgi:hypothetical protein
MANLYRDGFGKPIPNEDESIRAKLIREIANKFAGQLSTNPAAPRVEYTGNVRAGSVIYTESDLRIEFWHEMGGGLCQLFISIPQPDQWEEKTQTPLSRRDEIVRFVAQAVQRDQAPSWRYEIGENEIAFF